MSFFNLMLTIAIMFTISGVYIYFKEDFFLVPKLFYKNLKDEDRKEFITNYGKGVFFTGVCLVFALVDLLGVEVIRWSLFGFTLAYSDLYLKRARKLNVIKKLILPIKKPNQKITVKAKTYSSIVSVVIIGNIVFGAFLINSLHNLANNRPFEDYIDIDEVAQASINITQTNQIIELDKTQLKQFVEIFENIVVYEEIFTQTFDADMLTYKIFQKDGTVIEVKAMGNILSLNLNGDVCKYVINENVSEEFIFFAFNKI